MYETITTAVGRVASPVSIHEFGDGTRKASFRIACNERRRDWKTGQWSDGESLYVSVTCWRSLAESAASSLSVGDPVVVRGRLHTRQFETQERRTSIVEIEASAIGPDLARCTVVVTRPTPTDGSRAAAGAADDDRRSEPVGAGVGNGAG